MSAEKPQPSNDLQPSEVFQQRIEKVLNSAKFKKAATAVGRYTEGEGREAALAVYGTEGPVQVAYDLPDPADPLNNIGVGAGAGEGLSTRYSYYDREGLFSDFSGEGYRDDLFLAAHSHPVHTRGLEKELPSDMLGPSIPDDIEWWATAGQWSAMQPTPASRVIQGVLVKDGDFNKLLLAKKSEKRSWIPRYLQYEGENKSTPFLNKVLTQSGVILVTIDLNAEPSQYREQAAQVAATLAEK